MERIPTLLILLEGNPPVTGAFLSQRPSLQYVCWILCRWSQQAFEILLTIWDFTLNPDTIIVVNKVNTFENVISKILTMLFRPRWVKALSVTCASVRYCRSYTWCLHHEENLSVIAGWQPFHASLVRPARATQPLTQCLYWMHPANKSS